MKKLFAMLLAMAIMFLLTACGSAKIVGEWELESMKTVNQTMTLEDAKEMGLEDKFSSISFKFNKDGSASTKGYMDGDDVEEIEGEWKDNGDKFEITFDGATREAKVENGKLVIMQGQGNTNELILKKK